MKNRLAILSLTVLAFLLINQISLAAPTSAPPSPNQPDAQFNSISVGGAVAGVWTFMVDSFGSISNPRPNKVTGAGYTPAQCAADGGYLQVGDNSCHYTLNIGDNDGIKTSNIRITGGSNGVAGTMGEPSGGEKYGANFTVTSVNPGFPKGTYQGSLMKGVGEFAGGLFKFTSSDGLNPNTEVQLADGKYAIDATGDVSVTGHLKATSIGGYVNVLGTPGPIMPPNGTSIVFASCPAGYTVYLCSYSTSDATGAFYFPTAKMTSARENIDRFNCKFDLHNIDSFSFYGKAKAVCYNPNI